MSTYGAHAEHGDAQKREAQYQYALNAAVKGASAGFAVTAPAAYYLHRTWQPFTRLTLPLKVMFVSFSTIAVGVIAADKAGIAFDQLHYTDRGAAQLKQYQTKEEREWGQLSAKDKALTWAKSNKFGIVAGSWVVSMGGIFAYIQAQPMTFAQKLVQTRVWAQGITLASLVAMAGITQIPSAGDKILYEREHAADHSWRDFIRDSEDDKGQKANAALAKRKPSSKETTSE